MRFNVQFKETEKRFNVAFRGLQKAVVRADVEYYEGEYEVMPKSSAQTLRTKEKFLTEDVNIKAIPYSETGNTAGGKTVYIGTL